MTPVHDDRSSLAPDGHELTRALFDRIPLMIALYEPSTQVLHLNREFERVVGWTTDDARHVDLMEQCYPDPAYRELVREHMQSLQPGWRDVRMTTRDGRVIETSWANIRLSDGTWLGVGIEIGERKRKLETLEILYRLADFIGRARGPVEIHEAAIGAIRAATGASRASLLVFDEDGVMRFKAWHGLSDAYRAAVEGHSPWSSSVEDAAPIVVPDVLTDEALRPLRDVVVAEGIRALAFIPLVYGRRLLGKFMIYHDAPHVFDAEEIQLAATIAHHVAFGLERARVETAITEALRRERRARADAEAAERRASFLSEATRVMGASLDHETTLQQIARLAVPELADGCTVDVLEPDGTVRRVAITHCDPGKEAIGSEVWRRYPPRPDHPVQQALRTGRTQLLADVTDAAMTTLAHDAEHLRLMRELGMRSMLVVPLVARGRVFGAVQFITGEESGRTCERDDVEFAEELVGRAAQAIENARLYAEVETASQAKDNFLAMLAHELRNPLGVVANALTILDRTDNSEDGAIRTRDLIRRQVQHLARLLDDLLDVARITRGRVELRLERLDLRAAVEQALEAQRHRIEAQGQTLDVRLPDAPIGVLGDPARLQQIVGNLLNNACKYTPKGGAIRLTLASDGDAAVVQVADTGVGIPPERLDAIFDLFTQLEPSLARKEGGLGIGLTLVKQLVELHRGSVRATSNGLGKGAEFIVRLPLAASSPAARTAAPAASPVTKPLSMVLVEDNDDARHVLITALELDGHRVFGAATGRAGIELALREKPAAVLIDIGLPDGDGIEVGRELRERLGPEVVLIALTGYGQPEDRKRSKDAGFDGHVVKPVEPDALQHLVSDLVSRKT